MRVVVELAPEIEEAFLRKVRASRLDINVYVERLILEDGNDASLAEQRAPVQKDAENSSTD